MRWLGRCRSGHLRLDYRRCDSDPDKQKKMDGRSDVTVILRYPLHNVKTSVVSPSTSSPHISDFYSIPP